VSIIFDARKNAEHSKRVVEIIEGAPQLLNSVTNPKATGTVSTAAAQQPPVVRSLLQAQRSESFSGEPLKSNLVERDDAIESATLIARREPVYPTSAKQSRITGNVEVHFRISPQGKAYHVKSVKGPAILARAVIEAVEGWCYEPARLNGAPIDSEGSTDFEFKLD
jgi:TonB family protein